MDGLVAHVIDAKERTEDVCIKESSPFSKMLLSDRVRKGLHQAGFVYPTMIQATAIPLGKSGLDLLVQSKSGTGKTLIFCTIILEAYSSKKYEPQSLIVVPTRELAVQIESVLNEIGRFCQGFSAVSVIGGMDLADDRKRLQKAKAVVGTPGRLVHIIRNEVLNTSGIQLLVLDEADQLYNKSFRNDVQQIQRAIPLKRQTLACSATFCDNLEEELAKIMRNPLVVSAQQRASLLVGIKQFSYELKEHKTSILEINSKLDALKGIFKRIAFKQCLIFAGSQSRASSYCNYLEQQGWPCELISGAQNQKTRLEMFQKFRDFKIRILIATDLMSRGIDSEYVNLVINLELPTDVVTYLHRIGRAGRFGSHGIAINFIASEKDRVLFKQLINKVGNGMQILKFPNKVSEDSEERDIWDFSDFSAECDYYGCFGSNQLAPLASQEADSYVDLQANKENVTNNKKGLYDSNSSVDTNTFQVDSVGIDLQDSLEDRPQHAIANGQNLTTNSHQSSTQQLSNTIDDASSITADSVRSSQQEASLYQSILMQKAAIPTLVEFLVDQKSEKAVDGVGENEAKSKQIDFFEDYKRTLEQLETESSSCAVPKLITTIDAKKFKSLLIDQPTSRNECNVATRKDIYSDYANFDEDEPSSSHSLPTAATGSIDKATFILSVATPTQAHESIEELQNSSLNSSRVCSMSETSSLPEGKHFPSPVHNQPMEDVEHPETNEANLLAELTGLQKIMVNVGSQVAFPEQTSPLTGEDSADVLSDRQPSPISNDTISIGQNASVLGSISNSNTARSGFEERVTSTKSSDIDSSPEDQYEEELEEEEEEEFEEGFGGGIGEGFEESVVDEEDEGEGEEEHYYEEYDDKRSDELLSGSEDSEEFDETDNYTDEDDDEEENYFDNDEKVTLEDNTTDDLSKICEAARETAVAATNSALEHLKLNEQNNSKEKTQAQVDVDYNVVCQEAYRRWMEIYWQQLKFIQNHVKFSSDLRKQQ